MSKKGQENMAKNIKGQNKRLKAFLVSYVIDAKEDDLKSVVVTAFTKKEAGDLFIKWTKGKNVYDYISGIVVQGVRMTKRNAHFFTKEYYDRQNAFVNSLGKADA